MSDDGLPSLARGGEVSGLTAPMVSWTSADKFLSRLEVGAF